MLTNRNDNARTSVTLAETVLNTTNVAPGRFGLLFTRPVMGQIYAQPLYVPGVMIGGRARNVVYVATEHNMVYAFDAENPAESTPLWSVSLGMPVPVSDIEINGNCPNLTPEIGITSTPVIDLATRTLYVVAKTRSTPRTHSQHLHALDLATGMERTGSPALLAATVPGTGGGTVDGMIAFDAFQQLNRPGLALSNGVIYMAFASHCDHYPFHGWILAYDAATLTLRAAYNDTPNGENGGIWQSGTGLSVDEMGDIYFSAGDGTTTLDSTPMQLGQSVGRLRLTGSRFEVVDYFTPFDHVAMTEADFDLGSTGVLLMPATRLAIIGSKEGFLYMLNRDAMGHFHAGNDSQIVQSFRATHTRDTRNIHGGPVYWNSPSGPRIYIWGEDDVLKAFAFDGTRFNPAPTMGTVHADSGMPGGILSVSANNSVAGSGIVWVNIPRMGDANERIVSGTLRAFDASDVSHELWNSDLDPRDESGLFSKFTPPTIANGRVYLATFSDRLDVYGLR